MLKDPADTGQSTLKTVEKIGQGGEETDAVGTLRWWSGI
jgi:hypothetical protein